MTPVPLEVAENWESAGVMTSSEPPPRPTGLLRPLKGPSPRALVEQNAVILGWAFEAGVIPKLGVDPPSAL